LVEINLNRKKMVNSSKKIGVEISWRDSGKRIGVIEFLPEGVLIFRVTAEDLFPTALRPVEQFLKKSNLQLPLYRKYEKFLTQRGGLPIEVLEQEAALVAGIINQNNLRVAEKVIEAKVVHFVEQI
jgi:hypothetical protein